MHQRLLSHQDPQSTPATRPDFFHKTAEALSPPVCVKPLRRIARTARSFVELLAAWQRRSTQREQLRELPDHLLKDIGITRAQADWEAAKRFWMK